MVGVLTSDAEQAAAAQTSEVDKATIPMRLAAQHQSQDNGAA